MSASDRSNARSQRFPHYDVAFDWLRQHTDYERGGAGLRATPHLLAMRKLGAALGHPELALPTLHVAGTKGKGSTCSFAAALLRRAGLKIGTYLSPHLSHPMERISIQGEPLAEARFAAILSRLADLCDAYSEGAQASFFDLMTLSAFVAFKDAAMDAAVIEVGMGGRLDSTNVVLPEAAAITSISFDHMSSLGRSLAAIGREKAGIAKPGRTLVLGIERDHPAFHAIAEHALEVGAPLRVIGEDFHYHFEERDRRLVVETWKGRTLRVAMPMVVPFQVRDLAIALALLEAGAERGRLPDPGLWLAGDGHDLRVPGRFELIASRPPALLDGAHNDEAFAALAAALQKNFPKRRLVAVIGAAKDKLHAGVFAPLTPHVASAVATRAKGNPRAARATDIAAQLRADGIPSCAVDHPAHAWHRAVELHTEFGLAAEDPILVTGSFYLVGELRPQLVAAAPASPCSNSSKISSSPTPS